MDTFECWIESFNMNYILWVTKGINKNNNKERKKMMDY